MKKDSTYLKQGGKLIMSKGEEKITFLLSQLNIPFTKEKTFSDLKNGQFRFDFYLPNYKGQQCIIEFNGE